MKSRENSYEDILLYLNENSKDFIQFKTSLLNPESGSDPIKRADTIRDIVGSISKIPDRIKREVYIQECAKVMNISEEVLFNTLAQLSSSKVKEQERSRKKEQQAFEVLKTTEPKEKTDVLFELERKIIEMLLLYGDKQEEFEDLILKENDEGDLVLEPENTEAKVYEKVYFGPSGR